ncbi:cyclase family protein [Actinacidiphila sp. ITFR-21]|uniref:cyclase family protein n=1 Tax=Actinacidiphila sp. ITFR-21 TaxID=3075199 RepID=UPI00288BADCD|nr:cyclase family protein [Streptomyces sp. ITFR-21]WNI14257.1 cyclase family protein [Streptomyces sp. ITFR-21]
MEALADRPGNWSRWPGAASAGALNTIGPEQVVRAAACVRLGRRASLGIPIRRNMPQPDGHFPALHMMFRDGGDFALVGNEATAGVESATDFIGLEIHGAGTHVDALSHVWRDGQLFDGVSRAQVRSSGAHRLDIAGARGIVTRGVLLDVEPYLDAADAPVGRTELERAAADAGVDVEAGDAVLLRTGWLRQVLDRHRIPAELLGAQPGLDLDGARWLAERDVAVVGADNQAVERRPDCVQDSGPVPVHQLLIREYGVHLVEWLNLEELGTEGVHEFMFVAAPLPIVGGTGSPVDPVAIW